MVRSILVCAGVAAVACSAESPSKVAESTTPCCDKTCELPLVKYFSTDAPHGFCGEACMDPKKFDTYHKFEANLTRATAGDHPCSQQRTPDNSKYYTDYFSTVTHGFPGVLTVTLDLYAPKSMPDHSCCDTPLFASLNCFGIPGKPKSMNIFGTGPFCCPSSATETTPCASQKEEAVSQEIAVVTPLRVSDSTTPCCDKTCELPLVKYFSTDAPHGFCGEACMDPKKFDTYHKFEANLTRATAGDHPCSQQRTPDNSKYYTDYFSTVTHGFPGVLTVTLDLYAPTSMPDHSCCDTPLFASLNCFGIPGKPKSMNIFGTGPFCCPSSAAETTPCASQKEEAVSQELVAGCEAGGSSLCGCSELIEKKLIHSFDDCTQEAAMAACNSGKCEHSRAVVAPLKVVESTTPCCDKTCELPLVKYFSTDAPHGFCGEACMDPKKFDTYHKFEANLTRATAGDHPCSQQRTPDNTKQYTDYFSTVTHGFPGVLTVTLDLYAPTSMPDHSCCDTPLFASLNCFGIPGKPKSMSIFGTGPFCCPSSATETAPCASERSASILV